MLQASASTSFVTRYEQRTAKVAATTPKNECPTSAAFSICRASMNDRRNST
jgi:hypothetical protein